MSEIIIVPSRFSYNFLIRFFYNFELCDHSWTRIILCTKCNFMPSIEDGNFPAARLGY